MFKRIGALAYGVITYAIFFATFAYAAGWVGNILVAQSIDSAPVIPLGSALLINIGLLAVFALQHSIMARPGFKRWWTRYVPKPIERSTFVLFSSLLLIALFVFWQPLGSIVWQVQDPVLAGICYGFFGLGWAIVLISTLLINHFDLFGLRQVWLYFRGIPYTPLKFHEPGFYKYVRHPLYVGWLLAFWVTPTMTVTHLVFALVTTAYILAAIRFEERDLIAEHGQKYIDYRKRVPMLIPKASASPGAGSGGLQTGQA
jgi:protein-S-isoprenylcysteine O-methyltransferase Ste14